MRWVKHVTTANKDDKLISIRAEFGMWGIGVYWTLVELTAEKITEKTETAEATLIVSELLGFFGCKRNKLETFLEHSANVQLFNYTINGNILKIDIPKLLKYADNYIKYDGKSLKTLQRQSRMSSKQDIDTDIDIEKKKKKSNDPTFLIPEYLNNPDFIRTFHEFIAHRKEIKKPLTQRAGDMLLKKLCEYSCNISIKMLEQSIENGWQGVFDLKGNGNGTNSKASSTISRATFRHGDIEKQHLRELKATLDERDRERNLRAATDSKR